MVAEQGSLSKRWTSIELPASKLRVNSQTMDLDELQEDEALQFHFSDGAVA